MTRQALLDSVRHHLVADVPVAAFLSAGIDSGALVGLMSEVLSPQTSVLSTITLAFAEFRNTHQDEAPLAQMLARHYGVSHRTRIVDEQEFREDLPRILAAMDQPSIDGINTSFVSKAAKEAGLKVAISGLGGGRTLRRLPLVSGSSEMGQMVARPLDDSLPLVIGHCEAGETPLHT